MVSRLKQAIEKWFRQIDLGDFQSMRKIFVSGKFIKAALHVFWFLAGLAMGRALTDVFRGLPEEGDRAVILITLCALLYAFASWRPR